MFSKLPEDVLLCIFFKLEDDPRNWARLACVCTKFSSRIRNICWKDKCNKTIPSFLSDLLSTSDPSSIPGGWSSLFKLSVCCPGLLHAGVLLEHSDFGLERELGPDDSYQRLASFSSKKQPQPQPQPPSSSSISDYNSENCNCSWSLFDDLYYDTVYDVSEANGVTADAGEAAVNDDKTVVKADGNFSVSKRRKVSRSLRSHLASGVWNLTREQGNKLLASRFRDDSLYICDWPGCVHIEEKRNYMLFRGIFKNFKRSRVWRTINDAERSKVNLNCAFCGCKETWDLLSAFCLRRAYGYHEDGEPFVRAYVCENGHVSGAWTDLPLFT